MPKLNRQKREFALQEAKMRQKQARVEARVYAKLAQATSLLARRDNLSRILSQRANITQGAIVFYLDGAVRPFPSMYSGPDLSYNWLSNNTLLSAIETELEKVHELLKASGIEENKPEPVKLAAKK